MYKLKRLQKSKANILAGFRRRKPVDQIPELDKSKMKFEMEDRPRKIVKIVEE